MWIFQTSFGSNYLKKVLLQSGSDLYNFQEELWTIHPTDLLQLRHLSLMGEVQGLGCDPVTPRDWIIRFTSMFRVIFLLHHPTYTHPQLAVSPP